MNPRLTQWQIITRDHWLLFSLTLLPVMLSAIIWATFAAGLARNLPVGIVDMSHTPLSHSLINQIDASPTLSVTRRYASLSDAAHDLKTAQIYAYVVLPYDLERNIRRARSPKISVFYNSQFILVAKQISSAMQKIITTFNVQVAAMQSLAHGEQTVTQALSQALPIRSQITALFNSNTNYTQFLVSAIVPAIWQIIMVTGTVLALTANYRLQHVTSLKEWIGPHPARWLLRTLWPYSIVFLLQGILFLVWFYHGLSWPMHGTYGALILAQIMTVLCCMCMGTLIYFLTLDAARAMSFAAVFTAPSFAFMGVTFPASDMNIFARAWRAILPVSHYISAQIAQSSYGASLGATLRILAPLSAYGLIFILAVIVIRVRQRKEVLCHY